MTLINFVDKHNSPKQARVEITNCLNKSVIIHKNRVSGTQNDSFWVQLDDQTHQTHGFNLILHLINLI